MLHEKRFFRSLFKTVLLFAFLHITLLIVLAVTTQRMEYLNVFEIVGLSYFFPGIEDGVISFIASTVIIAGVFLLFYKKSRIRT